MPLDIYAGLETGPAIAVGAKGNVYVTASTNPNAVSTASEFPTTPGAFQTTYQSAAGSKTWGDAFVTEFTPTLSGLVFSTYLGGNSMDAGTGIAVDSAGDVYVTGWTRSTNFPTDNPIQGSKASGNDALGYPNTDAFVTVLNPTGTGLLFSTYFGGSNDDYGYGIALDPNDNIYVTGVTTSTNFPTTAGAFDATPGGGFVFKISAVVTPGSFGLTGTPSTTAGAPDTITVTALNPNGTVNTNYTGTVAFTSTDPRAVLPANFTFTAADRGVYTFTVTLKTAGTQSIAVADTSTGVLGVESGITVTPAAAGAFDITGYPSPTNAGLAGTFTVTALDPYGNVATGYTGTVAFGSSDPAAALPAEYTFTAANAGAATFRATLNTTGTQSLTATDVATGITGTESNIAVDSAGLPAVAFTVTGFSSSTVAGTVETITVTARDANGNVAPSYRGTIHFSSTDPQAVLPANFTFTNVDQGVYTFTVTLKTAGVQSITATDVSTGSITGSESHITITPAAASQFVLTAPASVKSGSKFSTTLEVEDAYGNVVTGYTGTVHFTSSDSTATLPANFTFTAADDGEYTFTNAFILKKKGTQSITVTDTKNSALTATDDIDVT